ncbi:UDP-N-acetylmuramate--L-alanine ligase [Patescibacteria group bacterium]|nr:UDP-N-acetylmuramate--L-alanine ligase [Patescibacteria group bacterium]
MKKRIHFIGIGGIGVSALAKYYLKKGWQVLGSDLTASEITIQMKNLGAKVHIGKPKASLITTKIEKVIFSPAVPRNHPERMAARKKKIQELSYPKALGELTKKHYTIAVSGTHGKSTTTAMLGLLLTKAGLDPTVIVGTRLKEFGNSNCRVGKSKYLVIEADEHFASFLNYRPQIIILTSLEADHLDFYKTLENLIKTFKKYVRLLPKDGIVVANRDDKNVQKVLKGFKKEIIWYSKKHKGAKKVKSALWIPGEHNVSNALSVLKVARLLNVPDKKSLEALSQFKGSWRRFELFSLKKPKPYTLVSDYGHHPTEIKVTIEATREKWPKKNIWLVYQPHQYQRTFYLFKDFVRVLSRLPIQKLLLMDIYDVAGREEKAIRGKVSSQKLIEKIQMMPKRMMPKRDLGFPKSRLGAPKEVLYIPTADQVKAYLKRNLTGGEVVVVMGAGDIYQNLTLRLCSG